MTTTTTTREEFLGHDDASVRIVHFPNGDAMTVAINPDTAYDYCLECDREVTALAQIVVIDREQWDYPEDDHAAQAICPLCYGTDMCSEPDANGILRERAEDAEAERRFDAWHDGDRAYPR
jgi:hypothetical protein